MSSLQREDDCKMTTEESHSPASDPESPSPSTGAAAAAKEIVQTYHIVTDLTHVSELGGGDEDYQAEQITKIIDRHCSGAPVAPADQFAKVRAEVDKLLNSDFVCSKCGSDKKGKGAPADRPKFIDRVKEIIATEPVIIGEFTSPFEVSKNLRRKIAWRIDDEYSSWDRTDTKENDDE